MLPTKNSVFLVGNKVDLPHRQVDLDAALVSLVENVINARHMRHRILATIKFL